MPFSVRHFSEDDKLCHHMNLDVLQDLYSLEAVSQVRDSCHAWEKREKALNMVTILYLVIALLPLSTLDGGRRLAPPGQWGPPLVA